jgi:hypothetical protein
MPKRRHRENAVLGIANGPSKRQYEARSIATPVVVCTELRGEVTSTWSRACGARTSPPRRGRTDEYTAGASEIRHRPVNDDDLSRFQKKRLLAIEGISHWRSRSSSSPWKFVASRCFSESSFLVTLTESRFVIWLSGRSRCFVAVSFFATAGVDGGVSPHQRGAARLQ